MTIHWAEQILHKEIRPVSLASNMVPYAVDDAINLDALRRMKDELRLERDRLNLLLELTSQIVSNLDLRNLLRKVSTTVRRVMECNAVAVHLPDRESSSLRLFALDSLTGLQTDSRDGSWLEESGSHEDICEVFRTRTPIRSIERRSCAVPLVSRNRVLGVLELGLLDNLPFGKEQLEFVTRFAGQVAIAIENALAYGEIKELKDRLAREKLYLEDEIRSERGFEEIIGRSAVSALCCVRLKLSP